MLYIASGVLALSVSLTIYLYKNRKTIRIAKMIADVIWMLNYLSQGAVAYTGALQNVVCLLREFVFLQRVKERKWADSVWWCILFCALYCITPVVTWQGWFCLLPAVASIFSTVALFVKDEQLTRWLTIPAQLLCLLYSIRISNVFSTLGNVILFASAVSGLILETWRRKTREEPSSSEDNTALNERK